MYALQIRGTIKVLDPATSEVIPPFSMILNTRYATRTDADVALRKLNASRVSNGLAEVVEV